ncbi:MAG TPA: TIGR03087 family PEP-CTERM/XrtA system glycosyltransferase [Allosphingosinicella sp.]|nr:TIGR03087 family PEP-CTERM/XrtA system glycosyltransferase [Allosphingosinicella sp.]
MMRDILFLAHRIPYPPDRGDKIRSWHVLRHLSTLARVHLACFADDERDAAHLPALRAALGDRLGEVHVEVRTRSKVAAGAIALVEGRPVSLALFDSPKLRAFAGRKLADEAIGTVFAFSGQMGQFVPEGVRQRFVMDFGDVDSAKFAQYADEGAGPMRWVHRREGDKLAAFERAVAARADLCLFVSEAEAALFRGRTGLANIRALSNGIDVDHFSPAADFPRLEQGERPLLLFTGQMDYPPNAEAVAWFARAVLPLIPGARFVIAGRDPPPAVRALAGERVIVTGAVADMRSWLAAADVIVAPLKLARGIQNKVLEAMAMAKPVVASPAAFEGIEAVPGRDLLVAGDAAATAAAVKSLLEAPGAIGAAARRRMEQGYRWEARLAPLAAMVDPSRRREAA